MEMTLALAKQLDPDLLQVGFFTPYPGSPYYEEVFQKIDDRTPTSSLTTIRLSTCLSLDP